MLIHVYVGNDIIARACDEAWDTLNTYWQKTDEQTAIVISLILDPRCKLEGLANLGWQPSYIKKAKAHFTRVYMLAYRILDNNSIPGEIHDTDGDSDPMATLFGGDSQESNSSDCQVATEPESEIDRWLREPRQSWKMDGATWWKLYGYQYPKGLAIMARNYLGIPASSVPAERLFSKAGKCITVSVIIQIRKLINLYR